MARNCEFENRMHCLYEVVLRMYSTAATLFRIAWTTGVADEPGALKLSTGNMNCLMLISTGVSQFVDTVIGLLMSEAIDLSKPFEYVALEAIICRSLFIAFKTTLISL